ncbi:hypothetical protein [Exiguobacterium sp. 17-1]|uniref:hypothetical protein n=1 Tax=Exiguobacterium sp. 17-1 TaxID=2931981 RepID=UPI001FFEE4A4|nr:hypothetical protein [Exiguobacterium sp. 17-1]MCK2157294.1 hypothetical protein [Exiguobacterium sp. 17-1]
MKNKQERTRFIQEAKRRLMKQRMLSALLYGTSIILIIANRGAYWPFAVLIVALVLIARLHSKEVNRYMALTPNPAMKRIIQIQYVIDYCFIVLVGLFLPVVLNLSLPFFTSIGVYLLLAVVLLLTDTVLERRGKVLDPEHPTKKELRTYPKTWKKLKT